MAGKQQTHYEIDMCNGPILSKMLRFSIPLMCSSVLQLLFNAADIVVVGRWAGDNSLAAVGSNTALIGLLTNLFVGLAAGFQGILFSLSNVVIQSSVNTFGEVIMAGNSAAANIEQFVYVSMNAMYQATISFTSQNYGAGNYHRIRKIMIRAQGCVLVVGLVLGNAATLAGRVLLSIYTTSPPVIEAGLVRMGIVCTTYALCGMMDVMVGGLRGIGYSIMPMLVSLVGACGLRLLWIATIFQLPQFHTIQTIYWSYPISWAITFGVHVICFLWAMKKVKRQLLPEGAPAPVEVPPTLEEETVSE